MGKILLQNVRVRFAVPSRFLAAGTRVAIRVEAMGETAAGMVVTVTMAKVFASRTAFPNKTLAIHAGQPLHYVCSFTARLSSRCFALPMLQAVDSLANSCY